MGNKSGEFRVYDEGATYTVRTHPDSLPGLLELTCREAGDPREGRIVLDLPMLHELARLAAYLLEGVEDPCG